MRSDAPEGRGDPDAGTLALHARLGHHDVCGRKTGLNARDHIAAGGCIRAGDDTDGAREAGQRTLALCCEQSLGCEHPLQALDRREVVSEPDPLDRARAEAQLAPRLVQLCLPLDEHPLTIRQSEVEPVEAGPLDRGVERGAAVGIFEREEDERPRLVPAKLRELTLDPDRGEPAEDDPDPLVEG